MIQTFQTQLKHQIDTLHEEGLYKHERKLISPQRARIRVAQCEMINFCANNYLGLADNPVLIKAAERGLHEQGLGMASALWARAGAYSHPDVGGAYAGTNRHRT